jgi:hypothetical protein
MPNFGEVIIMNSVKIAKAAVLVAFLGTCLVPLSAYAAATTNVTVVNTATQPVPVLDVQNPAKQPFQYFFNFNFDPTQGGNGESFIVPVGKRLIIEFVSATMAVERGSIVDVVVDTTVGGVEGTHHLVPTSVGAAWGFPMSYIVSKDMRVYADPGTKVSFGITDNLTGNGTSWGTISGYLISVP